MTVKGFLLTSIIVAGILVLVGVFFIGSNTVVYTGSDDIESYSLELSGNDYTLTHEKYESNSYVVRMEVYNGIENNGRYYVHSYTEKVKIFGTLVSEKTVKGMDTNLLDYVYMVKHNGAYVINNIPISVHNNTPGTDLAGVTTAYNYENHGEYTTIIKGSTKADLAEFGIAEIYSDGTAKKYELTESDIGDIDLTTCGVKNVMIKYGNGSVAYIQVDVVDFICSCDTVLPGTSLNKAIESGSVRIIPEGTVVTSSNWDSKEGARMITLTSEEGYSKACFIEFVSGDNKEVDSFSVYGFRQYIEQGSALPAFTFDMTLKNGKEYEDISSTESSVTGYDRNKLGPQVITVQYDKCAFNIAVYVYNSEQSIPVSASLILGSFTPHVSADGKILYDRSGINYQDYSIEVLMTDGSVKYLPLTRSMINTPYGKWISPESKDDLLGTVRLNIDGFRYYEDIVITYDPLEQNIKDAATIGSALSDSDTVVCTVRLTSGTDVYYVIGTNSRGLYLAADMGSYSSFIDKYTEYGCIDGTDHFKYNFGTETTGFDITKSLLKDAVMLNKTHDQYGVYIAEFDSVISESLSMQFPELGLNVGEKVNFNITYDSVSNRLTFLKMNSANSIDYVTCVYDPTEVHYSDHVRALINQIGTVTLIVNYSDGSTRSVDVLYGAKYFTFVCDEGYSLYTDSKGRHPYEVPSTGITATTNVYYL